MANNQPTTTVPIKKVNYLCNIALADLGETLEAAYDLSLGSPRAAFKEYGIPYVYDTIHELLRFSSEDYQKVVRNRAFGGIE